MTHDTPKDWLIHVGESEGNPLLIMLDRSPGRDFSDKSRQWAIMVELPLDRTDSNALPPQEEWPQLEAVESALVRDLATDEDDWRYVVRIYGEGVARYCFYAKRSAAAKERVARTLAEFGPPPHRVSVQPDPTWSAYRSFFPEDEKDPHEGVAPSFRDEPAPTTESTYRPRRFPRDDQPWRGEEHQAHPED